MKILGVTNLVSTEEKCSKNNFLGHVFGKQTRLQDRHSFVNRWGYSLTSDFILKETRKTIYYTNNPRNIKTELLCLELKRVDIGKCDINETGTRTNRYPPWCGI